MITTFLSLSLAFAPSTGASLEASPPALVAARDEYGDLYKAYKASRKAYRRELSKARREGGEVKTPAPISTYFDRFDALAKKGSAEALLFCALEVEDSGRSKEEVKAYKVAAFERLGSEFSSHEIAAKVITKVGRQGEWLTDKQMTTLLGTIAKKGAGTAVRSDASYQLARRLEAQGTSFGVTRAGEIYEYILKTYPDSRAAKRCAERQEGLKLAPGNQAPDFSAVDPDGNAFKLSDYRGKVVVLDFWGFW
jgi:hypothetical protein